MLGVWQIRDGDGPVIMSDMSRGIEGDKQLPMIDIDTTVVVEDGAFTGIFIGNETSNITVSPESHNQYYLDLPPVKKDSGEPKWGQPIPAPLPMPTPKP